MTTYNVLLIGSGGREHVLAWKLRQSEYLNTLYVAPGNQGTASLAENVDLEINDFEKVADFARAKEIDLVVIGPERPLVDGLADYLEAHEIPVFGPGKDAARLEGSKEFAKQFMKKYDIPTADYETFDSENSREILDYIRVRDQYPVVLKADGLAAGKGVFICENEEEVRDRLTRFREDKGLSSASDRIVVEEYMEGEEASVFVISDGHAAKVIHNAQDHKRIGEGDTGLNTGGMGAYTPAPVITPILMEEIQSKIIQPAITGMQLEEAPYKGILYVGLMMTNEGPRVVEFNCRFGDPECQAILPLLKNDLLELMIFTNEQRLDEKEIHVEDLYSCCVVLSSGGYPEAFEKGKVIEGLNDVEADSLVFHAATASQNDHQVVTAGGRVLNVVGTGSTLQDAIDHAYRNVQKISFEKMYYRSDIGKKGLRHLNPKT